MKPVDCPKCGRAPVVAGCDVFCGHCVDGSPDADQLCGSGKTAVDAIDNWNENVACHVDNAEERRASKRLENLPLQKLQTFAWETATIVEDAETDPKTREYARILNKQAHAEITRRHREVAHAC